VLTTLIRRSVLRIRDDLAIEFANTAHNPSDPAGSLAGWRDLVDFLELRGALGRPELETLRAMGETDARRGADAFEQSLKLRETIRSVLGAMAAGKPLRASWIADVNEVLAHGMGSERLVRHDATWRLGFVPLRPEPLRALAPIARSIGDLISAGPVGEVRRCANPRCVLFFRDRSRTRRRRWCSMAICGNRIKVATHLRRQGRRAGP